MTRAASVDPDAHTCRFETWGAVKRKSIFVIERCGYRNCRQRQTKRATLRESAQFRKDSRGAQAVLYTRKSAPVRVDAATLRWAVNFNWYLLPGPRTYVYRTWPNFRYLHREIMRPKQGLVVDHKNGDPTDNRRVNLRVCAHARNCQNRQRKSRNNTSGVTGVYYAKRSRLWVAQIVLLDKRRPTHVGAFRNFADAVAARKSAEAIVFGEFSPKRGQ